MVACSACGKENPEGFEFCGFCTAPLTGESREQRKTVTMLFCDVTGSTALGESTDPEALRALLARYFERMRGIVESHGGTVEKFIGDAVMAVFGVPVAHEDDALRACRAAVEMRDALPGLGVQARIGVNTGEVVTGTEERLATGDAVNVAARLEQAAQPGEVLLGAETMRLLGGAVEADAVESLELKGKRDPVPAFRLVRVGEAPERSHESRFVGREDELVLIREAWARALAEQRCVLVTVVGDAGIGKSRLIAEALAAIDARVVRGRCLPYGDGITYWPLVEVLKQLDVLPSDPAAAAAIESLLGRRAGAASSEEIAWAFRALFAEQAPLVVVLDDVQWGEDTFLDLVEGVALFARAPILLVCMARPELLDRRPQWPVAHRLEPLAEDAVDELIAAAPVGLRKRIATAAGGNPLFLTEMLAIAESGDVDVPPNLRALLAARLDQLELRERSVLECGSVEGEVFHRGAVQVLAPDEAQVTPRLASLTRKELIRSDRAIVPGDEGFRFRHLLIRDAAYDGLPKATRAELHERYADWLEQRAPALVELDEVLGYHLERAAGYLAELGQPRPALAERAGEHLAAAGRRALARVDEGAAVSLLERSLRLVRPHRLDIHLELDLAEALEMNDPRRGAEVAAAAAERATGEGRATEAALAETIAAGLRHGLGEPEVERIEALTRATVPLLEQAGDHDGLRRLWAAYAFHVPNTYCRFEQMAEATRQANRHAELAGQPERTSPPVLALAVGPCPADEALREIDAGIGDRSATPPDMLLRAYVLAMLRRFDEAWPLGLAALDRLRAVRGDFEESWLGQIARLEGDHQAAIGHLSRALADLQARRMDSFVSGLAPELARELCGAGRHDEARPLAELGRRLAGENDIWSQTGWRQAQALLESNTGSHGEAERLTREAVALADRTDALNIQGDALCDLAEVLRAANKSIDAADALEQALERYERKKNLAMVAQVRPQLEALKAELSSRGRNSTP